MPVRKKVKLPEGMHELYIKGVKAPLIVQLVAQPVGHVVEEKVTIPDAGHHRFYVECERLAIYTVIGADNQHHASNKATKLFGPHWSCCSTLIGMQAYQFVDHKDFKQLLATLPN